MPIYREILYKKLSKIIIWKITEDEDTLLSLLNAPEVARISTKYKNLRRRKQYIATQLVLNQMGLYDCLVKDENGKPHIKDATDFISISHDTDYVAIIVSSKACGIDLQHVSEKTLRIRHKFLSLDDSSAPERKYDIDYLSIIWGIKEAIYKINGEPMVYFKEHIRISKLERDYAEVYILHPDYKNKFSLHIQKLDDIYLIYTT